MFKSFLCFLCNMLPLPSVATWNSKSVYLLEADWVGGMSPCCAGNMPCGWGRAHVNALSTPIVETVEISVWQRGNSFACVAHVLIKTAVVTSRMKKWWSGEEQKGIAMFKSFLCFLCNMSQLPSVAKLWNSKCAHHLVVDWADGMSPLCAEDMPTGWGRHMWMHSQLPLWWQWDVCVVKRE